MTSTLYLHDNWRFSAANEIDWHNATVPGCIHTDLQANGLIPDPFYGTHEGSIQWIDKQDWLYETAFDVPQEVLNESQIEIVFEGLDTYAEVFLNDTLILSADNMFRTWRAEVKRFLKARSNRLHIRFRSPIQEDLPKLERLGYGLPATNDQSERGGLGDKKLSVFSRKAPYHYGWDWGPRLVTSGIWRPVKLEAWSQARITDVYIHQSSVTLEHAVLEANIDIDSEVDGLALLQLHVEGRVIERQVTLRRGMQTYTIPVDIPDPRLWWPRGYGEANLYTFRARVLIAETVIASRTLRTGLRDIQLVQTNDDMGTSFYFQVNGVPVFAKGANHIPNDSFITEVDEERYRHEIVTASESNMNMLRVWGGGVYEDDCFYNLCDEYGIMVWQDFMFACSMYPGDEAFLRNVEQEAKDNVRRLRNHPCIVLWCGNNEIDTAWAQYDEQGGWGWKQQYTSTQRAEIWSAYEAIFHRLLPDVVARLAPGAAYWPSSPMQALTGDINQHAKNDSTRGDIHYWGVWHAVEPFSNYNVYLGRFMSEYGFQSFPELRTVRSYASEADMELESDVMKWHQRSGDGNRLIKEYMDIYLPKPKDFPAFLTMSQVLQAEAIQTAIEAHRRKKPYCMGSLYWQINDCWPVASWSSMDYFGRWKALQYYAKRSFRDIAISFEEDEEHIAVQIISDGRDDLAATLHVQLFQFDGQRIREHTTQVHVEANRVMTAFSLNKNDWTTGCSLPEIVLVATLENQGHTLDQKCHYFTPVKELRLDKATITVRPVNPDNGMTFLVETNVFAKSVMLTTSVEGVFSDNYFDLVPGLTKTVTFLRREPGDTALQPAQPGLITASSMCDWTAIAQ
ncbi:glycoside hydrolase family 2 TIM barrel [Alicyclobacillus hesperidum URH17-3-68]|uniref:beta-mannosidase n=1 Tax=Alicyclobacillus hesperidum TaxID=89784 RepID=UPI000281B8A3|nr:glycoside hydrolase family 2 protein [Alicyclobacillus hesperidum]EJY56040.1 glycoside hydrolase family 2 TIM barrel [Alicyclobacillus hesperidum URH17-3-68]